ncbi:hypothetical protein BKA65DRAFT_553615 [Rhexocercosporidium sp. MPI-PUGE-AT-0058]|nr:hypothetical protein BKA65DRAFT_553615 [Rhexocercosporidium sp. MPI-PUGE-AT-0058]
MVLLPDPPAFCRIRLATFENAIRLGIICTASFRYSEQLIWEPPLIEDPRMIVAVVVDKYELEESSKTEAIIPADNGWTPLDRGDEVVVGMAVWRLELGSKRIGHFQPSSRKYLALPGSLRRDENPTRVKIVQKAYEKLEHKYFGRVLAMERIAIHPDLAKIDKVNQAVLATSMGANLFKYMGFKLITERQIDGGNEDPTGYTIAVLEYQVNGGDQGKFFLQLCIV